MAAPTTPIAPTAAAPPGHPRFPLLDGVRALAALSVLVLHVADRSGFAAANPLGAVTARLDVGVAIFFVLSGFLLYRPFAAARLGRGPAPEVGRYLRRRAARIVPAYWVALAVTGLLGWATVFTTDWWRYFAFLHVYEWRTSLGGIVPMWTLAIEVSFYVALPLWVLLAGRVFGRRVRAEALALAAVAAVALVVRLAVPPGGRDAVLTTLPAFIDWFALGMALALLSAARGDREGRLGGGGRAAAWAGWAGAAALFAVVCFALGLPRGFYAVASVWTAVAQHVLYGLVAASVVLAAVTAGAASTLPGRVLGSAAARWLGLVSYGVFLWHYPLLQTLADAGLDDAGPLPFVTLLAATLAGSIALGWLSWRLIERPAMALGARRAGATPAAAPAPASAG